MCKYVSFDTNNAFRYLVKNAATSDQMQQLHEQYSLWRENEPSRYLHKPVADEMQRYFSPGKENARLPVLLRGAKGPCLAQLTWGFIPNWRSDRPKDDPLKSVDRAKKALDIGRKTWNSASETMFDDEKPTWRDSAHDRRCVIILDGYFTFHYQDEVKYPFYVTPADGDCMAVAGLWDVATIDGEEYMTCAILTQEIDDPTFPLKNSVGQPKTTPIVLQPEHFDQWLEPIDKVDDGKILALDKLMVPSEPGDLEYITVAKNEEDRLSNDEQAHTMFEYKDLDIDLTALNGQKDGVGTQ